MAVSKMKVVFQSDTQRVWEVVTSLEKNAWRSDLSKTQILSDQQFIEYTKDGFPTTFTITKTEPYKCWEFDMENKNIKGHWTGIFTQIPGGTEVEFTEEVTAKKAIIKPFVKAYLKKQQERYISDLRKALGE